MNDDFRNRLRKSSDSDSGYSPRPTQPSRPMAPKAKPPEQRPRPTPVEPTPPPKITRTPPKRPKKRLKKVLIFLVLIMLIAAGSAAYWFKYRGRGIANNTQPAKASEQLEKAKPTGTIRFIATGDNFTFDSVNANAKKPDGSYDYSPLFSRVKPLFDKTDVRLCNESVPTGGDGGGISGFPNFNAPTAFARGLEDLGCNVINMGTSHMNDKGQPAIDASVNYWDSKPNLLAIAGANRTAEEQGKIRYFTVKEVKFAFLSYTTSSKNPGLTPHGVNIYSDELVNKQVAEARKNAQFVVVSVNWGTENSPDINVDQDRIAQSLTDLNADVVVGVGPHVLQPAKVLTSKDQKHQTLVWFSLGNFLNSQVPIENLVGGIAVMNIDVATQNIKDPAFLPTYMHYEWTAEQKKRASGADLAARQNLALYPLDQAADPLARSQNGTTVQAQTDRVKGIMTKFIPIKIINSTEF